MTIVCAYCGKKIGNDNNSPMENIGLWNHIKNKHWNEINPKSERINFISSNFKILDCGGI